MANPNRLNKPSTDLSEQGVLNNSFDREFNVLAVEALVYNPTTLTLDRMTQPGSSSAITNDGTFATPSKQDTGNNSTASLDNKTPALGQALAAGSTPVVLTAAQILSLTPQTNGLTDAQLRAASVDMADPNKRLAIPYSKIRTASDTITPSAGKKIKILKSQVMQSPDNTSANTVTLNFASLGDFSTGWAYADSNEWVGATNEVLNITLGNTQSVSVNIRYKEI